MYVTLLLLGPILRRGSGLTNLGTRCGDVIYDKRRVIGSQHNHRRFKVGFRRDATCAVVLFLSRTYLLAWDPNRLHPNVSGPNDSLVSVIVTLGSQELWRFGPFPSITTVKRNLIFTFHP